MILDSFYLLFKTQGVQDAERDIAKLDDQITKLAAKGKKRSEEETKEMASLRKQRLATTQDLKDQTKQTDELGLSFNKLVEGVTSLGVAYFSLSGLKAGVFDAEKLNNALAVQAKITGQNAGELRGYAQALESAGGSGDALLSFVATQQQQFAASNLKFPGVPEAMQRLHDLVKGKDITQQTAILDKAGALGLAPLLEQNDEQFKKSIDDLKRHAAATNEAAAASREFDYQWKETGATFTDVFSRIDEDVLPRLTQLLRYLEDVGQWLHDNPKVAEGLAASFITLSVVIAGPLVGAMAALVAAGAPLTALLTTITAIVTLIESHKEIADWIDRTNAGQKIGNFLAFGDANATPFDDSQSRKGQARRAASGKRSESNIGSSDIEKQSYAFWVSQGYSPDQAAVLVGNQKGEGWKNNSSVGDGGTAFGIAQWHPNRTKDILDHTGIDVKTAPLAKQLEAQKWEMENRYGINASNLPGVAAGGNDFLVNNYEKSKNRTLDSMKRTAFAAQIAQQNMPGAIQSTSNVGGDRSTSVKIDTVNVNTQATDPNGIAQGIGPALQNELRNTISNWDDGVQA